MPAFEEEITLFKDSGCESAEDRGVLAGLWRLGVLSTIQFIVGLNSMNKGISQNDKTSFDNLYGKSDSSLTPNNLIVDVLSLINKIGNQLLVTKGGIQRIDTIRNVNSRPGMIPALVILQNLMYGYSIGLLGPATFLQAISVFSGRALDLSKHLSVLNCYAGETFITLCNSLAKWDDKDIIIAVAHILRHLKPTEKDEFLPFLATDPASFDAMIEQDSSLNDSILS